MLTQPCVSIDRDTLPHSLDGTSMHCRIMTRGTGSLLPHGTPDCRFRVVVVVNGNLSNHLSTTCQAQSFNTQQHIDGCGSQLTMDSCSYRRRSCSATLVRCVLQTHCKCMPLTALVNWCCVAEITLQSTLQSTLKSTLQSTLQPTCLLHALGAACSQKHCTTNRWHECLSLGSLTNCDCCLFRCLWRRVFVVHQQ